MVLISMRGILPWRAWSNELGIDYSRLESILRILVKEGFLEDYDFISEFV